MKKTIFIGLLLSLFAIFPNAAFAADTVPDNLLVSLWPEYNNTQVLFMQQIELPASTPLPATIRFAFPVGAQMRWTGEIVGSSASQDIAATPAITQKDGYQEVVITLTKSRIGQAEAMWDGLKADGNNRSITLNWIQYYESKTTTFEFMEPSQSKDVVMAPAPTTTRQSPEGFTYYLAPPISVPVGQSKEFKITYSRAVTTPSVSDETTAQNAGKTAGTAQNPVSNWVLLAIFLVAGAGIAAFVYRETAKSGQEVPGSKKKAKAGKNKESKPLDSRKQIFSILVVLAVLGAFAVYSFSNTSQAPAGNNCEENVAYLQKGVDDFKTAWGVAPTNLKQLLEKKDGKGPFVETITLKCPSDGTYYTVENGEVIQSESTEPPK